jgi:hypothetical protein
LPSIIIEFKQTREKRFVDFSVRRVNFPIDKQPPDKTAFLKIVSKEQDNSVNLELHRPISSLHLRKVLT